MQKMRVIVVALCLMLAAAVSAAAQEKSLFERLGGMPAIDAVIEDFVGRVAADSRINQKFARSNIPRVKKMLKDQVCAVAGGPCKYTGLDMKTSHKNMKVTDGEFNALVDDLVQTLDKFKVPEKEKSEVLGALGPLRAQIVEVSSSETGTGLPSTFKPAPPLGGGMSGGGSGQRSLYDRLGGEAAISAVIDDFAGRVLADGRINKKFARTNAPRLLFFLKQQVCAATGGPCKYEGLSMKQSHKNMKVTEGEFGALVGHLVDTLNKFNVPEAEKSELLGILGPLKGQIVEVQGDATGTPLPANFKPAKPLSSKKVQQGPFNNAKKSGRRM